MEILVPVKRVADPDTRVRLQTDQKGVDLTDCKMVINPFCAIALEAAVQLRESGQVDKVQTVSVGNEDCLEQLIQSLALGADEASLILHPSAISPVTCSYALARFAKQQGTQLIIMGKQAIDTDNGIMGPMLAGILGWSQATNLCGLSVSDNQLQVEREVDRGTQRLTLNIPAVLTVDLRMAEPRFAPLPKLLAAKRATIARVALAELVECIDEPFALKQVSKRATQRKSQALSNFDELKALLIANGVSL